MLCWNPKGQQLNFFADPTKTAHVLEIPPGSVAVEWFFLPRQTPTGHPFGLLTTWSTEGGAKDDGHSMQHLFRPLDLELKMFPEFCESWHWCLLKHDTEGEFSLCILLSQSSRFLMVVRVVYGAILSKPSYHRLVNDCTVNGGCCCGHMNILNFRNRLGCWAAYVMRYIHIHICMHVHLIYM